MPAPRDSAALSRVHGSLPATRSAFRARVYDFTVGESSYISGGLPFFLLGCGLTPVPELSVADARELARIILEDKAVKNDKPKGSALPAYSGKHISYTGLVKRFRGSDKAERVYASVRIFMRARLFQSDACREVAKILGSTLGNSKRGRPAKNPRHRKQKDENRPFHVQQFCQAQSVATLRNFRDVRGFPR